jgi:predicted SAM-dependent methyltransferase
MANHSKARRMVLPKVKQTKPKLHVAAPELRLDLGSGQTPADGFEGVDLHAPNAKHRVHLWNGEKWPWADSSVDAFHCSHVIEHIDAAYIMTWRDRGAFQIRDISIDALLFFFDEAWRCAKPGATFKLIWPALQSVRAFQDPTHRRYIPMQTLAYLDKNWREMQKLDHYLGSCDWVMENCAPTCSPENAKRADVVQQRLYLESWNFSDDFIATLRARKA